jgi:hypothetical protein
MHEPFTAKTAFWARINPIVAEAYAPTLEGPDWRVAFGLHDLRDRRRLNCPNVRTIFQY